MCQDAFTRVTGPSAILELYKALLILSFFSSPVILPSLALPPPLPWSPSRFFPVLLGFRISVLHLISFILSFLISFSPFRHIFKSLLAQLLLGHLRDYLFIQILFTTSSILVPESPVLLPFLIGFVLPVRLCFGTRQFIPCTRWWCERRPLSLSRVCFLFLALAIRCGRFIITLLVTSRLTDSSNDPARLQQGFDLWIRLTPHSHFRKR